MTEEGSSRALGTCPVKFSAVKLVRLDAFNVGKFPDDSNISNCPGPLNVFPCNVTVVSSNETLPSLAGPVLILKWLPKKSSVTTDESINTSASFSEIELIPSIKSDGTSLRLVQETGLVLVLITLEGNVPDVSLDKSTVGPNIVTLEESNRELESVPELILLALRLVSPDPLPAKVLDALVAVTVPVNWAQLKKVLPAVAVCVDERVAIPPAILEALIFADVDISASMICPSVIIDDVIESPWDSLT